MDGDLDADSGDDVKDAEADAEALMDDIFAEMDEVLCVPCIEEHVFVRACACVRACVSERPFLWPKGAQRAQAGEGTHLLRVAVGEETHLGRIRAGAATHLGHGLEGQCMKSGGAGGAGEAATLIPDYSPYCRQDAGGLGSQKHPASTGNCWREAGSNEDVQKTRLLLGRKATADNFGVINAVGRGIDNGPCWCRGGCVVVLGADAPPFEGQKQHL